MGSVREYLASRTTSLHQSVDARGSSFDLATDAGLSAFLRFMLSGSEPVESALTTRRAEALLPEWPSRRQSPLLAADIGSQLPPGATSVAFESDAEAWGALYVLEGSRLGTRFLGRTTPLAVGSDFFQAAMACRFWPEFLRRLETADRDLADRAGMASGAEKAFYAYLQ